MVKENQAEKELGKSSSVLSSSTGRLMMDEKEELLSPADLRGITVQDNLSCWDKLVFITLKVAKQKWEEKQQKQKLLSVVVPTPTTTTSDVDHDKDDDEIIMEKIKILKRKRRSVERKKSDVIIKKKKKQSPASCSRSTSSSSPSSLQLELPQEAETLIRNMEGKEILPLIEKYLTASDVKKEEHRLLMPMNRIISPQFLGEEERDHLIRKTESGGVNHIKVVMIEPNRHVSQLSLKRWDMKKDNGGTTNYVLTGGWRDLVKRNNLSAADLIQIWTFRVGSQLHLLLLILQTAKDQDEEEEP